MNIPVLTRRSDIVGDIARNHIPMLAARLADYINSAVGNILEEAINRSAETDNLGIARRQSQLIACHALFDSGTQLQRIIGDWSRILRSESTNTLLDSATASGRDPQRDIIAGMNGFFQILDGMKKISLPYPAVFSEIAETASEQRGRLKAVQDRGGSLNDLLLSAVAVLADLREPSPLPAGMPAPRK